MNSTSALQAFKLDPGVVIAQAVPWQAEPVNLDSPALSVMTDLTLVKAALTAPSTTLAQAEQMMILQGVRMLFVVTDAPSFEGLVTSTDLRGERQMRAVHERGLHYDELTVADVMTRLAHIDAIDMGEMRHASVGNVIATLQRCGRDHLLVSEATAQGPRVRGVISRSQVERQCGAAIAITPIASSFSEIERALAQAA